MPLWQCGYVVVPIAAAFFVAASWNVALARKPRPIDWNAITAEAVDLLSKYIQIDTTNPPGNELKAARFLKEKFLADGIPAAVFEPEPGRGIVAARLHGIGKHTQALVLLCHMDVVPADAKEWSVPPFSGAVEGGEVWGRGALDDKGPGVVELMAVLAIKRAKILLDRDILFLATADEETGGRRGAGWLISHEMDLLSDVGYVLNEGGEIRVEANRRKFFAVAVTEKTPLWLRLTTTGVSGHASTPPEQTAVTRLIRALNRLADYRPQVRVNSLVSNFFRIQSRLGRDPAQYDDLLKALRDPAFSKRFLAVPAQGAMVRNTITPTVVSAGAKTNVIPPTAWAELDCRLLPGQNVKAFIDLLHKAIADENVKVEQILNFPSASSPKKSRLMAAIEKLAATENKSPVAPMMLTGFTDSHYFRQQGMIAYGFMPIELTAEQSRTMHGANERMPIKTLRDGIERMVELLKIMGGR